MAAEGSEPEGRDPELDRPWTELEGFAVAGELIRLFDENAGWAGEGGLQPYRAAYRQFDPDGQRIFRARLIVYLAKQFAPTWGIRAIALATATVDRWFPAPPSHETKQEGAG